jgi:hypothetical protein
MQELANINANMHPRGPPNKQTLSICHISGPTLWLCFCERRSSPSASSHGKELVNYIHLGRVTAITLCRCVGLA